MFVLVLTDWVIAVVGWVVMFALVLTGLVVAVAGWGCYVCSGFDWFGCSSRGVYCLGCVWYGFVSFVDDRLVFLSSLQRYSFSAILSPCLSQRMDERWDGSGTGGETRVDGGGTQTPPQRIGPHPHNRASLSPQGHRPRINALTISYITTRLCPRKDIDLTLMH